LTERIQDGKHGSTAAQTVKDRASGTALSGLVDRDQMQEAGAAFDRRRPDCIQMRGVVPVKRVDRADVACPRIRHTVRDVYR